MSLLDNFRTSIAGNGSISESNGAVVLTAGGTGNSAIIRRDFPAIAGTTYSCTFVAKALTVGSAGIASSAIDYPADTFLVETVDHSTEFNTYKMSYTVPFNADPLKNVTFAFGIFSDKEGSVTISDVKFKANTSTVNISIKHVGITMRSPGGFVLPGNTLDIDIHRVGDVVTLTGNTNTTVSVASGQIQTAVGVVPEWATPLRKSTQFGEFSTFGNYFIATEVGEVNGVARFFKRVIGSSGISDSNFGTTNQVFSISYVCKGLTTP